MTSASDICAGRLAPGAYHEAFSDLHAALDTHEARVAAERCLFCYDAPCVNACPTGIDIPLFIRQIATGNPQGAGKTILDSNIFGGMCARVCPTETLCEEACVRNAAEGKPVIIGELQRHATDAVMASGRQLYRQGVRTGKRVAVVGAGPAGLSCAHRLATLGYDVVVFDGRAKPGGLNEHGIASYKSTNDFAQAEVDWILSVGGIELRCGQVLGRDFTLADLRRDFDAVFLGLGLQAVNALGAEGDHLDGVEDAVAFIEALRQSRDLSTLPIGRRVVVIGGGMTAIDAAVQAKKLGAEEVTIVYRRGGEQMGASRYEHELALINGVVIRHWARPVAVRAADGALRAVSFAATRVEDGRLVDTGETFELPADQLFRAIGQVFIPQVLAGSHDVLELEGGRIAVDFERRTTLPGVWAGGDCAAGGRDLTVVAVEDGKQAALSINRMLQGFVPLAAE
ncbi:dihydropyrimidine dehydrogenase [Microvirga ossetica]|uniref:dihydrouracil dehydrogenase (NAD(+)) n=1 Tax=Microvirga ossetica TaxID=1882682 RepID=A0A1B2EA99_9HYPH|nr:NAD(P)-dependent oxidoreductase [Microvirga ossetica]ANY76891.1 dihydropyrimidine dehydrogenase [Microvirga ossetica]